MADEKWTEQLYKAMSRGKPLQKLTDIVNALGGTRAVAQRFGVSQRQVQRYVKADKEGTAVKSPRFAQLKDLGRKAPELRRQAMSRRRASRMKRHGAHVKIKGTMGVRAAGRSYFVPGRWAYADLSPEAMDEIREAWEAGDDDAAREALERALGEEYVDGFELGDLDQIEFQRHSTD
jgi:hypothetical protein